MAGEEEDHHHLDQEVLAARQALRTPRAAAVAGIVFALLFGAAIVLMRVAIPADPDDAGEWVSDGTRRQMFSLALQLIPFAGIAFLWFIGVVRTRLGEAEDRFFATVFLGSGLLFVAMIFATAAVAGGLADQAGAAGEIPDPDVWEFGRRTTYTLTNVYAMRMAAVFTLSSTTMLVQLRLVPRWLVLWGFATALALLVASASVPWSVLAFPAWVLGISVYVLVTELRPAS